MCLVPIKYILLKPLVPSTIQLLIVTLNPELTFRNPLRNIYESLTMHLGNFKGDV